MEKIELVGSITLRILSGIAWVFTRADREMWRLNLELLSAQPSRKIVL